MSSFVRKATKQVHRHVFGTAQVAVIPALEDNYAFLLRSGANNKHITVAIDTPDATTILDSLDNFGWSPLRYILNTHGHYDHVQGTELLKQRYPDLFVIGSNDEVLGIPHLDERGHVEPGDKMVLTENRPIKLTNEKDANQNDQLAFHVLDVGGHTLHHIAFHFHNLGVAFVGDSLFPLGCGRLFEGSADQAYNSLLRIAQLPPETVLFSAHEYSESNSEFALSVDPTNKALRKRVDAMARDRALGVATVPAVLRDELLTNPFMRCGDPLIRKSLGKEFESCSNVQVFTELRSRKDKF